jgi:haloalkane dehalogenase
VDIVRTPEECFGDLPQYPFAPHYVTVEGGVRMHYVDEGPPGGEPILLLHGQPTWSYLYRTVIPVLTARGLRVIAPDLVGFGRSDKPTRRTDYSLRSHTTWLGDLVAQLALTGLTVVVQDWGGPIGLGVLAQAETQAETPQRVARIVAANTALHTADASLAGALDWPCHSTPEGDVVVAQPLLDYQRMTQELPVLQPSLFVQGATVAEVDDAVLAAYDAPFPDETYCAGARQFPLLMGLTPGSAAARQNRRTMDALGRFTGPFLTAFSDGDPSTAGWAEVLRRAMPVARHQGPTVIRGAGHFLQEDKGPDFGQVIADFVRDTPL